MKRFGWLPLAALGFTIGAALVVAPDLLMADTMGPSQKQVTFSNPVVSGRDAISSSGSELHSGGS